jgi:hypothetical protein
MTEMARLTDFVFYAESVVLKLLAALLLGVPFALIYFTLSWLALDILMPVAGSRFLEVWLATGTLGKFFAFVDAHGIAAALLLRVDVLAAIASILIGWPAGHRLRRSFVDRTPIAAHAGLLSDRLSFAILLIPVAIGVCALGTPYGSCL